MRRTKEDAEKTRRAILDASVKLFAEKGVAETSLEEIGRLANVTRGAIYWHFKNKIEIFDELHKQLYQPLSGMILNDMEVDHPDPLQQIKELSIALLIDVARNEPKRQAIMLFLMKANYTGELEKYRVLHRERKHDNVDLFSRYFEKARSKGILPPDASPDTLALAVRCFMKGIVFEYLNDPEIFDMELQAPRLMETFFGGLVVVRSTK